MNHRILASTVVALIFAGAPTPSAAAFHVIGVTDAVTGTPGAWVHDFTVANNLPGTNAVYFFGVKLPSGSALVGSPEGFAPASFQTWTNEGAGASSNEYNNLWIDTVSTSFQPGMSISGFRALDTGTVAATEIPYFVYALGDGYEGPDCWRCGENPGFEGIALVSASEGVTAVPEPASWAMLIGGFGLTGAIARRRRGLAVTA